MAETVTVEYRGVGNQLIAESRKVDNAVDRVNTTSKKTSRGIASSFKYAAAGIASAGIITLLKGMFSEAEEAKKTAASTAQGIKTMGAASWTSAKQIGELSESISNKIGVDDELIQSSANLLLTFGKVRNETGKMNNIFDRSVAAAQDLAAKGFGDANSSAKMLGKALNDPIKGITALSKAGVTFTQGQKDQIKSMVESGNILGAQKIIMAEVERQVKGTAEATASGADKMKVRWANFQEQLGTALMPILLKVLGVLGDFLKWASQHQGIVIAFTAITASIWLLNVALNANPVIRIITLLMALGAAIVLLWNKNETFRKIVTKVWNVIKAIIVGTVKVIVAIWNWLWRVGSNVVGAIVRTWNRVIGFFRSFGGWIGRAVSGIWNVISWPFKKAYQIISRIIGAIVGLINGAIGRLNELIGKANNPKLQASQGLKDWSKAAGFAVGGVVPGMPGESRLVVAHGGEKFGGLGSKQSSGTTMLGVAPGGDRGVAELINYLIRMKYITAVST